MNLGKTSHGKTSVQHSAPCSAQISHCCGSCSSSHTGAGHFLGKISITLVPTQQAQETSLRGLSWLFTLGQVGCHFSQSLLSSVGRDGGSEVPSLFSDIPHSARSVLPRPGRADQWLLFWIWQRGVQINPNHSLVLSFSTGLDLPSHFEGWLTLAGELNSRRGASHQVLLPAARFGLVSAKGRGTDTAVAGTCPLAGTCRDNDSLQTARSCCCSSVQTKPQILSEPQSSL